MKLCNYFTASRGNQARLAKLLGLPPSLLSAWAAEDPDKRRPVPLDRGPAIERATDGVVTCEELRPDEPWRRIPDKNWPNPKGRPVLDFAAAAKEAA